MKCSALRAFNWINIFLYFFREGSVVLGLSFWSAGYPEEQLFNVLQTQFSDDMIHIAVGHIYQDPGI